MLKQETLKLLEKVVMPSSPTLEQFISQSHEFEKEICERPTAANWVGEKVKRDKDEGKRYHRCIRKCYPILHEKVLPLIEDFVQVKKQTRRSDEEKAVYHDGFTIMDMIDRIISKVWSCLLGN